MAALSDLLTRVHDEFPAVPEVVALRALSDAVKEFCTRTHAWQGSVPRLTIRAGTTTYTLYPDTGTQIVALKDVRLGGTKIYPVATERVRLAHETPGAGAPAEYIQLSPTEIQLTCAPTETDRLAITAALTLTLGTTDVAVPDTLVDEYGEALAAGAKMRLVRQRGMPWAAPAEAQSYGVLYYDAINSAKARTMGALGEAHIQIEMRSWV